MPTAAAARALFTSTAVSTASNTTLLLMTYDRLVLDTERAEAAQTAGDRTTANANLQHAQRLLVELASALDVDAWEGGPGLRSLYGWLAGELVRANTTGETARTRHCHDVLADLRDTWREAAASLAAAPVGAGV